MKKIIIDGENLTIEQLVAVSRNHARVALSPDAIKMIEKSRRTVEKIVESDEVVYGLNTGFGSLSTVKISKSDTAQLQKNLIMSHACGVGEPFSEEIVRAIMLLRVNTFAKGLSGIRLSTVKVLIDMLNKDVYPHVPSKGSVGSSGDLAPLSHIVLVMLGMGEVIIDGERVPAEEGLKKAGIASIILSYKEGLALNNGTPVMTAVAALVVHDSENVMRHAIISSAMCFEALRARSGFLHPGVHQARPHYGQIIVAGNLLRLIKDSTLVDSDKKKVQDAYSIRATPVVLGASLDAIRYVKEKVLIEMNSATDNPLIIDGEALSAANFHGQHLALAMDFLGIALSEIADISERRMFRILDPNLNEGLPAFLIKNPGLNNGYMIPQYVAAALVSENKILAHPASVDSIPTCANQEDHVSMGTIAARKAKEILGNVTKVVAIEMIINAQALEMRGEKLDSANRKIVDIIRQKIARVDEDRILYHDIDAMESIITNREIFLKTDLKIEL